MHQHIILCSHQAFLITSMADNMKAIQFIVLVQMKMQMVIPDLCLSFSADVSYKLYCSNDVKRCILIHIHVPPDFPEEMVHCDCVTHVKQELLLRCIFHQIHCDSLQILYCE